MEKCQPTPGWHFLIDNRQRCLSPGNGTVGLGHDLADAVIKIYSALYVGNGIFR